MNGVLGDNLVSRPCAERFIIDWNDIFSQVEFWEVPDLHEVLLPQGLLHYIVEIGEHTIHVPSRLIRLFLVKINVVGV